MTNPRKWMLSIILATASPVMFAQAHGGAMPNRVPPPKPERAQKPGRPVHPLDRWAAMSPAQREAALAKFPPAKQQNIRQRLAKWEIMTEAEKERVRNITPEQRRILTAHNQWMQTLPQEPAAGGSQADQPVRTDVAGSSSGRDGIPFLQPPVRLY